MTQNGNVAMTETLESAITAAGGALPLLRNWKARAHTLPIVAEHTDWQSEQHGWRDGVVLMDQSHHMTDLFLQGPDALKLLTDLGVNSFANFAPGRAKQFIVTDYYGRYIGDVVLFYLPDGTFDLVGREIVMDWVQFHLETGGYDATSERDDNSAVRKSGPPKLYRYELQGPLAQDVMEKVLGGPVPEVKFFHMAEFQIAGHPVHALRHGMAGRPGYELFGPWADGEDVRAAILEAGADDGILQVGGKAYSTANLESGWVPPTLPGIFSGEKNKAFREWLPIDNIGAMGGSLTHDTIEEYYLTPFDLGYDKVVAFDHDFIGREPLEEIAADPARTKVTLVWNADDVKDKIFGSLFTPGLPAKLLNLPKTRYALYQKDAVLADGQVVGQSLDVGYISNYKVFVSLASVDRAHAAPGTEVTVLWGEDPVSSKPGVEPHQQVAVRATVAPAPYEKYAREGYRDR
jgi:vanillate/3-O-methylgallate O-demethylase